MIDANYLSGGAIALAGVGAGIGLVVFTEKAGERGGVSDSMSTKLSSQSMDNEEKSSVEDLGSLTSKLEAALKQSGGIDEKQVAVTEEDKKRIKEESDDGW